MTLRYITTFFIAFVLTACGTATNISSPDAAEVTDKQVDAVEVSENESKNEEVKEKETLAQEYKESIENEDTSVITDEFKQLEEFNKVNEIINLENAKLDIVEDNYGKRVLLVSNDKGIETHKTIYIKNKNRLKIIEFDKGQIFNEVI